MDDALRRRIQAVVAAQFEHRWVARTRSVDYRRGLLRRLRSAVLARAEEIGFALHEDLGKPIDGNEIRMLVEKIDVAVDNLHTWVLPWQPDDSADDPGVVRRVEYEPRGSVLILGPWNFPFVLLLEPLIPALAAGNTAVLKPNELAPATSRVSASIIAETFPEEEVAAVEGGIDVAEALLAFPFDHIFFTGSPSVGRIVMRAAAEHLASVTLELGGKNPAIIDGSTDLAEVARDLAFGRLHNSGQICLATDYVAIHEDHRDAFVDLYWEAVEREYYTDGAPDHQKLGRMVDRRNAARVQSYIDEAAARGATVRGGGLAADGLSLHPAVLLDVPRDARVMREEVFGPVLPIVTFSEVSDVVALIRSLGKPLEMYVFSDNESFVNAIVRGTSSGSVNVNGLWSTYGDESLPFGGINQSGSGRYHGVHGFRELSHERPIMVRPAPRGAPGSA